MDCSTSTWCSAAPPGCQVDTCCHHSETCKADPFHPSPVNPLLTMVMVSKVLEGLLCNGSANGNEAHLHGRGGLSLTVINLPKVDCRVCVCMLMLKLLCTTFIFFLHVIEKHNVNNNEDSETLNKWRVLLHSKSFQIISWLSSQMFLHWKYHQQLCVWGCERKF